MAETAVVEESPEIALARSFLSEYKPYKAREILQTTATSKKEQEKWLIKQVEQQVADLEMLFKELDDVVGNENAQWGRPLMSKNGITAFARSNFGSSLLSARLESTVESSLPEILACLLEYDLYSGNYPWPLSSLVSKREAVALGEGVDLLDTERKSVVLIVRSLNAEEIQQTDNYPKSEHNSVRVDVGLCGVEVKPISRNKCSVKVIGSIDPKVPFLPDWAFKFGVRCVAAKVFSDLRDACNKNVNRDRVRSKPGQYNSILRSLKQLDLLPDWI